MGIPPGWLGIRIAQLHQSWVQPDVPGTANPVAGHCSSSLASNSLSRAYCRMAHLQEIGEAEVQSSRALGMAALKDIYDDIIDLLADSPELRDLVATQTTGLTTEVIGEIRERTVSSDTMIDAVVRRILRRPTEPPEEMAVPAAHDN